MPYDPGEDEDDAPAGGDGTRSRFKEFDCPECSANNPYDDGIGDGDEVTCFYCGQQFSVRVNDSGRLKLRLL